jgi:hypothetical protein
MLCDRASCVFEDQDCGPLLPPLVKGFAGTLAFAAVWDGPQRMEVFLIIFKFQRGYSAIPWRCSGRSLTSRILGTQDNGTREGVVPNPLSHFFLDSGSPTPNEGFCNSTTYSISKRGSKGACLSVERTRGGVWVQFYEYKCQAACYIHRTL